jgi:hypothetical protein
MKKVSYSIILYHILNEYGIGIFHNKNRLFLVDFHIKGKGPLGS